VGSLKAIAAVAVLAAAAVTPQRPVAARAGFDRTRMGFADRIRARIVIKLDRERVDPSKLVVSSRLFPFGPIAPSTTKRTTRGRVLVIDTTTTLACLQESCLTERGKDFRAFTFPPVQVRVRDRRGRELTARAPWPVVAVERRVSEDEARSRPPPFRAYVAAPAPTYRFTPSRLALWLEVAAALLAVAAAALAGVAANAVLRARRPRRKQLDELERALVLVREARTRPPADRRKAAGLLARLLGRRDVPLAGSAERIAWSRPAPTTEALSELVTTAEQEVNGH
jgi:hypothetical protein